MLLNNKFELGSVVYLLTDPLQQPRLVAEFRVYMGGEIVYVLAAGTQQTIHRHQEISEYRFELPELRNFEDE